MSVSSSGTKSPKVGIMIYVTPENIKLNIDINDVGLIDIVKQALANYGTIGFLKMFKSSSIAVN